jgi:signal transduction histidine kinase
VRDDGVGFDVAAVREQAVRGASLGLLSMEERAALAGGGLELISAPGQGAEIQAWFPLTWQTPPSGSESREQPHRKAANAQVSDFRRVTSDV